MTKGGKIVTTDGGAPVRPGLVPGKKTRCGQCSYFSSMHPRLKTDCQDGYGIKESSRACLEFDLRVDYTTIRLNQYVQEFNNIASRYQDFIVLGQEVKGLTGQVFQKSQVREGVAKKLAPVRHVLRKEEDTTALIPFFEEVQRYRDRVSEILSLTIMWQGSIDTAIQEAESWVNLTHPEVRALKPEAIRMGVLRSVFSELYMVKTGLSGLHAQCDIAIKNFGAEHSALVEIQIASRSPTGLPRSAIADGEDAIPRGSKRWPRE